MHLWHGEVELDLMIFEILAMPYAEFSVEFLTIGLGHWMTARRGRFSSKRVAATDRECKEERR